MASNFILVLIDRYTSPNMQIYLQLVSCPLAPSRLSGANTLRFYSAACYTLQDLHCFVETTTVNQYDKRHRYQIYRYEASLGCPLPEIFELVQYSGYKMG